MFIFSLYLVYTSYKLEKEAKIYRENIKNEDRIYVSGIGYCTIDSIDSENVLVKVIVRKGRIYPTK